LKDCSLIIPEDGGHLADACAVLCTAKEIGKIAEK
jgi:hypothetical protein